LIETTKKIINGEVERRIIEAKNRAIYNATIEGNLGILGKGDPYDFIIETFKNYQNDPSYLDTQAFASIVYALDQECDERIELIKLAKKTLGSALIIAKDKNDQTTFNPISDKLAFLTLTDFGC